MNFSGDKRHHPPALYPVWGREAGKGISVVAEAASGPLRYTPWRLGPCTRRFGKKNLRSLERNPYERRMFVFHGNGMERVDPP